jgi:CIC family chloride channel protein
MTAIFGTPFAAILLAIELLLFEFSAKSFLPVMIACIIGACMHFILFTSAPTFPLPEISAVTSTAVITYALMGIAFGLISVLVTKSVYWIEDAFEKLPIHWMWWPALGGIAVGLIGLFAPRTLGVGYNNITDTLTGTLSASILINLCLWKFLSWAIALGSGTSGGTLAPLLTIGSAVGCLTGIFVQYYFPQSQISLPLSALVGMAAVFAGSSRAILTSIVFAMETSMQEKTLLPLIAGCSTAYLVSFVMMRSTIMTEKIKRRGILMPENYRPDLLELKTVSDIMRNASDSVLTVSENDTIETVDKLMGIGSHSEIILVRNEHSLTGTIHKKTIRESAAHDSRRTISSVMDRRVYSVYPDNSVNIALEVMLKTQNNILPVVHRDTRQLAGVITERGILEIFENRFIEDKHLHKHISLKKKALRALKRAQGKG